MRFPNTAAALAGCALLPSVLAYPGMQGTLKQLEKMGTLDCCDSEELIGDLLSYPASDYSSVGQLVRKIITGEISGESDDIVYDAAPFGSPACAYDTCCIWHHIAWEMERVFREPDGQCSSAARGAIRLGFHDAAGWSKFTGFGGGADGSILHAPEEMLRPANRGLEEIVEQVRFWYEKYSHYGISAADLIQFGANVATVVCPL